MCQLVTSVRFRRISHISCGVNCYFNRHPNKLSIDLQMFNGKVYCYHLCIPRYWRGRNSIQWFFWWLPLSPKLRFKENHSFCNSYIAVVLEDLVCLFQILCTFIFQLLSFALVFALFSLLLASVVWKRSQSQNLRPLASQIRTLSFMPNPVWQNQQKTQSNYCEGRIIVDASNDKKFSFCLRPGCCKVSKWILSSKDTFVRSRDGLAE